MAGESNDSRNGRLVGVSEAARVLGLPRRTVAGRLTSGAWPTAGWRRGVGGAQRLVDLAVLGDLLGRNGASAGSADGGPPGAICEPFPDHAEGLVASLVGEVAAQLQQQGLRELREARVLVRAVVRDLSNLNTERAALEAARRDLAAQRAAVRKLAADHQTARDAYLQREAELAHQLAAIGRRGVPSTD